MWTLDTGSAIDATGRVADAKVHKISQPGAIDTGKGESHVDSAVVTHLYALEEEVEAVLLPDASATNKILTVGRRCAEQGYEFYWHPWSPKPHFVKPSGEGCNVQCDGEYVPHLVTSSRPVNPASRKILVGTAAGEDLRAENDPPAPQLVSDAALSLDTELGKMMLGPDLPIPDCDVSDVLGEPEFPRVVEQESVGDVVVAA